MSFEEKYSRYKNIHKMDVSEDYVNKMVTHVSDKVSNDRNSPRAVIWGTSAVSVAALVFMFVFYPLLFPADNTIQPIAKQPIETQKNIVRVTEYQPKDSGTLASVPLKQESVANAELDQDIIIEYLLDEGYEEI